MWGLGIYFAESAKMSDDYYSYHYPNGNRGLFLAKVLVGDTIKLPPDNNLRVAPEK